MSVSSWTESNTKIDGQGTSRIDKAVPVQLVVTPLVAQSGTWTVGINKVLNTLVNDVASAALTTTTTTAAITPTA